MSVELSVLVVLSDSESVVGVLGDLDFLDDFGVGLKS